MVEKKITEQLRLDELSSILALNGWTELPCDLSQEELSFSSYILSTIYETGSTAFLDPDVLEIFEYEDDLDLPYSALQFFFDVFGYGTATDSPTILISFVDQQTGSQEYSSFAGAEAADIQFFFESLLARPAYMFQGTFSPISRKDDQELDVTWLSRQRTLNAVCVDFDGGTFVDGKHPIEPEDLSMLLEAIPEELTPSYITLTGNGVHFWYTFAHPIQTFSKRTLRRVKLNAMVKGLYKIYDQILEGFDNISVDMNCATLNHAFRAPGSLTKEGNMVRCFCLQDAVFTRAGLDAAAFSATVADLLSPDFEMRHVLSDDDVEFKTPEQLRASREEWIARRKASPATEKQLMMLRSLEDEGLLKPDEVEKVSSISLFDATFLISKAAKRRGSKEKRLAEFDTTRWQVKPHFLVSGKTGGVYNTVLQNIQKVKVGQRYKAMNMLAGVAYMMVRPQKTKAEVEADLTALLSTSWARADEPLNEHDVKSALEGYSPENWQTANTIVAAMGFSPFAPPAKRNGRSQEEHLTRHVPKLRKQAALSKIHRVLEENPFATQAEVARQTTLSPNTVSKYWEESLSLAGIEYSSEAERKKALVAKARMENPCASKAEISRIVGLSRPTVSKYWN